MPFGVPRTNAEREAQHQSLYGESAPEQRRGLAMYSPGNRGMGFPAALEDKRSNGLIGIIAAVLGVSTIAVAYFFLKR